MIQFEATIRTSKAKTPDTSSVEDSSQSEGQIFSTLKSTKFQLVACQAIVPLLPKLTLLLLFTLLLQCIPPSWSGFSKRCLFRVWTARRPSLPVRNTPRPSQAPDPSGENTLQSSSSSSSWFSMILQVKLLETHTVSNFQEKQYFDPHIELISDHANEDSD